MSIRSSIGAHDQCLHVINPLFVAPHVDSIGVLGGERCGEISQFLGQSNELVGVGGWGTAAGRVVMFLFVLFHIDVVEFEIFQELLVPLHQRRLGKDRV